MTNFRNVDAEEQSFVMGMKMIGMMPIEILIIVKLINNSLTAMNIMIVQTQIMRKTMDAAKGKIPL